MFPRLGRSQRSGANALGTIMHQGDLLAEA